jgi:hypothetical protein
MGKTKKALLQEAWEEEEAALAPLAFVKADAWARSAIGTPYGVTEPVRDTPRSGAVPDLLDPRRMAELLGRKVER